MWKKVPPVNYEQTVRLEFEAMDILYQSYLNHAMDVNLTDLRYLDMLGLLAKLFSNKKDHFSARLSSGFVIFLYRLTSLNQFLFISTFTSVFGQCLIDSETLLNLLFKDCDTCSLFSPPFICLWPFLCIIHLMGLAPMILSLSLSLSIELFSELLSFVPVCTFVESTWTASFYMVQP